MMSMSRRDEAAGSRLDKYNLIALLARGGMGNVYLASSLGTAGFSKLFTSVKELKPELVGDEMFLKMFLDEARLSARLAHPNIVQTFEVGSEGARHFIVSGVPRRADARVPREAPEAAWL